MTAGVGEGDDAPTRTLSARLRRACPTVEIFVDDALTAMGRSVRALSERASRVVCFPASVVLERAGWRATAIAATKVA